MMKFWMAGAGLLGLAATGAAHAAELKIEHAAARVVVVPEARGDVQVTVAPGAARLPALQLRRRGTSVDVDGGLRGRVNGCDGEGPNARVRVRGLGAIPVASLPLITARVPLDAAVSAGGALFGRVGVTRSLALGSAGCGAWTAADTAGRLSVSMAGSGDVVAGASRQAKVSLSGSGDARLGPVAGGLEANIAGSGGVRVASVSGRVNAAIAGSGDVVVDGGRTGPVSASIMGSGDVRVGGAAESLSASIMGSGDVRVAQVLGPVSRAVAGSGEVIVGR